MKVVFLDHDGVICTQNDWGTRRKKQRKAYPNVKRPPEADMPVELRFDNFDKKAIRHLNEILEATGAEIVISSDWKYHATLEELQDYYKQQGINKLPIDVTLPFGKLGIGNVDYNDLEAERCYEILDWLERHPTVEKWIAIDDLNLYKLPSSNFRLTNAYKGLKEVSIRDGVINLLS